MKRVLLFWVALGPIATAGCCWRQQQPYASYPPAPTYAPAYAAPPAYAAAPCQPVQQPCIPVQQNYMPVQAAPACTCY